AGRTNISSGAFPNPKNNNITVMDPQASVQIGGANPSQILQFTQVISGVTTFVKPLPGVGAGITITLNIPGITPNPTTTLISGLFTNPITSDALAIQNAINTAINSNVALSGGSVAVTPLADSPYGFVITFNGAPFAGKDIRLMTATVAQPGNPAT